jgi:hypothetical protein
MTERLNYSDNLSEDQYVLSELAELFGVELEIVEVVGPDFHQGTEPVVSSVLRLLDPFGKRIGDDVVGEAGQRSLDSAAGEPVEREPRNLDLLLGRCLSISRRTERAASLPSDGYRFSSKAAHAPARDAARR